jgi:ubiquinone/menaquinone biosynthesis C-methylase UbiE
VSGTACALGVHARARPAAVGSGTAVVREPLRATPTASICMASRETARGFYCDAAWDPTEDHTMSQIDSTRERLIGIYRKRARHYDITSRLYPAPGYPERAHRRRAIEALRLRPGDSVVEIACGTGLNFSLIEQAIGPEGRIVGIDLTDAMLAQAQRRVQQRGWGNVALVQADAAEFEFPRGVDAILCTYALTQMPECVKVLAHGAAALSPGRRLVVLDLKVPDNTPRWLTQLGIATVRPFGSLHEWIVRRPWDAIRAAMQDTLLDLYWTELFFGIAFLAAGFRGPRPLDEQLHGRGHE